jgi:hypothetical protein
VLERITIRNFKQFESVDIELGQAVVFVGPNNSGKTSALQALALWELGVRRWTEKRSGRTMPKKRSGVTINRRDLVTIPIPETNLLWRDLHTREVTRDGNKQKTENIRVEVSVAGVDGGRRWQSGLEFDYANSESIYCRPLGWASGGGTVDDPIDDAARSVRIGYLPPMSGLASNEVRLDPGAVQVRLGEGRTAEVLRNLCHGLAAGSDGDARWMDLVRRMRDLFGVTLNRPNYVVERGELVMSFTDSRSVTLDLTAAGRGLQQTLLILAFLLGNPGTVLLLDEPDAHLEILRQQQIYNALTDVARASESQIITASHSEVILNEAAARDIVVAFVGRPHRIDDRGSQVLKALTSIGYDHYYKAETTGWVLYLEGATDLAVLRAFARILDHDARHKLERPFAHYILNDPQKARDHFCGLQEAKPDLVGFVLTDNLGRDETGSSKLEVYQWSRREIENYLCFPEVMEAYASDLAEREAGGPLFERAKVGRFGKAMSECVSDRLPPAARRDHNDVWWHTVKASDDFLDVVFEDFFKRVDLPNLMRKTDYHRLAELVPAELIDREVEHVLDRIVAVAAAARPLEAAENESGV